MKNSSLGLILFAVFLAVVIYFLNLPSIVYGFLVVSTIIALVINKIKQAD